MNILCLGGWCTGNSAVLDYLDTWQEVCYVKGDFDIFRLDPAIYQLIKSNNRKKITIFRIIGLIANKINLSFRYSASFYVKYIFNSNEEKNYLRRAVDYDYSIRFNLITLLFLLTNLLILKKNDNKENILHWQKWVMKIKNGFGMKHATITAFCNPIYMTDNFHINNEWKQVFFPYKLIIIYRKPIDQFHDILKTKAHLNFKPKEFYGETEKLDPIDRYLAVNKKIHENRKLLIKENCGNTLVFSFEEFINNYDFVREKLNKFVGIESLHKKNKSVYFNIEASKKNIGIGNRSAEVSSLYNEKKDVFDQMELMYEEMQLLSNLNEF